MDKITHQVRAEHWAKIMNECINSGMSKTAWCRANGISVKQFFYWQRILRREAFENSQNSLLPATAGPHQEMAPMVPATQRAVSFTEIKLPSSSQNSEHSSGFSSGSRDPERQSHSGDFEFCIG